MKHTDFDLEAIRGTLYFDELATDRVLKARVDLITARRFYGVLVSNVEPIVSRSVPTMATNGVKHYFNPEFIMGLKKNWRGQEVSPASLMLGVQAHESEHDARHHGTRRGGRDPIEWNKACDYSINLDLIDEGFELPWGALIDERYRGMSAEDIYRTRELDKQKELPKPEEPEDKDDNEESEDSNSEDDKSEGKSDDESKDEKSDDGNGGDDDAGEPQDEPKGGGTPGEGEEGDEPSEASPGAGKGKPKSSGDPGGCGEVLDTAEDAGEIAEQDQKWERTVRMAQSMAKNVGELPGHVSREIERANNPPQDWREVLRAWFDQGALRRETWNRPNRRFVGNGLYLPGSERDGVNKVAFLVDTSGSMDAIALAAIQNEAQAALDDGVINEVVVIYGDTQVTRTDFYTTGEEIEFDPRGGGGTRLAPLFEHVRDNHDDVSLIVCFSDMENYYWGDEPAAPVLFAVTGYPATVKEHLARTPWGAPGVDVGVH